MSVFVIIDGTMPKHVSAIVMAAGASTRMGTPKQLLPYGDRTVLQVVVDVLAASTLDHIQVVLGHLAVKVRHSLGNRPVAVCVNPDHTKGMFSSILCGISALPSSSDGLMVVLGDQPQISLDVVNDLLAAYRGSGKGVVLPVHHGRRGHPSIVDLHRYGVEIQALTGEAGLKPVVRGHPEDTYELPVRDEGVLADLDTPEDYQQALARLAAPGSQ